MSKVCIIGLGYIGLPTATLLAERGFKVVGVDINPKVVEKINRGEIHIHEPDLDGAVTSAVKTGNLTASLKPAPADVFILAVPTPFKEDRTPDISYIESAVIAIAPYLQPGNLVILESTSPVGTTEKISYWLKELRPDMSAELPIYIAHCPERVLPGKILKELINNDRIIGGINEYSAQQAAIFYKKFVNGNLVCTDARTAELAKLAENAFRDVNIAFANELSMICDRLGINVWELIELANRHPRVNILQPGPGVGGHCIAVDPWFIVDSAPEQARLIRTAREVNDYKPRHLLEKIREKASQIKEPAIACLGLAYKADIDDLRESPAVWIVQELAKSFAGKILVAEPYIRDLPKSLADMSVTLTNFESAIAEANIVVLLVNHSQFLNHPQKILDGKIVIDARGVWRSKY